MNKETAKQILVKSITNLQNRRGKLTLADIETEVNYNACLEILKNKNSDTLSIIISFIGAAKELYPNDYNEKVSSFAYLGIQQNVAWAGMWDFLRDYFQKNHGIRIDNTEVSQSVFNSTRHQRFENDNLVSESEVDRIINVSYIDNKEEIIIEIAPSLSPKKARLISKIANKLVYKGFDPDYLFTIELDNFDEIENFTLELPNRRLKIQYFD